MREQTALNLIETLARDEAALRGQEFLAPLARGGRARLRVRGLIYELVVAGARPGWWSCRMHDARSAEVLGEALPWQRGDYLALWPVLRLVLIEPLAGGAWAALPYNPADAAQRFGFAGPLPLQLVEGGRPFERVIGRVEGRTIWYDDADRRADQAVAEALREALAADHPAPGISALGPGERAAYELLAGRAGAARATTAVARTERRLRHALEIGGARLLGYEATEDGLRVTWERAGQRSVTLVGADLGVISAGICLSGEDARFDLASVVGVVGEAPGYARWDGNV